MQSAYAILIFSACLFGVFEGCFGALPSSIKTCPRNHPDPNRCILDAVNIVRPLLAKGDLGDGYHTPPLEPLYLDNIEMGRGNEFRAVFSDIQARGGSNFIIEKLKANITNLSFDVYILLPKIEFVGKYSLKIRLLLLNINGKGDMRGTFKNARAYVKMRGIKVHKDGNDYVKFKELPLRIKVEDAQIHLDNLFGGDPVLGQVGNNIINDNHKLFLAEVLPGLEKGLSKSFVEISDNILQTATFDEMFPLE
ncbi:unnamed protein product [Hermetia illucens]|uniref:Uncharacterized protein n=1 Tax=Hermetia illucens TaxID=343691 RepID=A0A7R8YNL9_HERIL|nr:uncharacterized protein LOC119646693 [Hermetia illucens]CAD7079713.1 unnamed protein product [Hermetia illucens]